MSTESKQLLATVKLATALIATLQQEVTSLRLQLAEAKSEVADIKAANDELAAALAAATGNPPADTTPTTPPAEDATPH